MLTAAVSWRWGFFINVPIGAAMAPLARDALLVLDYAETRVDQVEQVLRLFKGARHAGSASGLLQPVRQVAGSLGPSLPVTMYGTAARQASAHAGLARVAAALPGATVFDAPALLLVLAIGFGDTRISPTALPSS